MIRILTIVCAALLLALPVKAQESALLTIDLAEDVVDITTGFNGAKLALFGVQEEEGDIAITITGPKKRMVVRRKENTGGIWMNRTSVAFDDVPTFYDFAMDRAEDDLATEDFLKLYGIGLSSLHFDPADEDLPKHEAQPFQKALLRNKQTEGMFPHEAQKIIFLNDHFFRTTFYIPANVPTGRYEITTYLIREGMVRDVKTTHLRVAPVGVSAGVYGFAHDWSFAYGLLCVMFAMSIGWLSNAIRKGV